MHWKFKFWWFSTQLDNSSHHQKTIFDSYCNGGVWKWKMSKVESMWKFSAGLLRFCKFETIWFFYSEESWFLEVSPVSEPKFGFSSSIFFVNIFYFKNIGLSRKLTFIIVIFWIPLLCKIGPNFCQLHTAPFKKYQNFLFVI